MKKILSKLILILLFTFIIAFTVLSTIGIKTNKFNKLISDKAYQSKNISLELKDIKFKLDPKQLSLFLATENPIITFKEISIPVNKVKIYVDFLSLFKTNPIIKKININFKRA